MSPVCPFGTSDGNSIKVQGDFKGPRAQGLACARTVQGGALTHGWQGFYLMKP